MVVIKRQTAKKCTIIDLIKGEYVRKEGWEPNYILNGTEEISRLNILAVAISKPENNSLIIDDGSGQISVRDFENNLLLNIEIGDIILIIGRPRVFNEEKYILPEIVKKINDKKWIELRTLELKLNKKNVSEQKITSSFEEKPKIIITEPTKINIKDLILKKISELDKGDGVTIEEVVLSINDKTSETIINNLLEEGDVFEIKPGKIKIL